MFKVTNCGFIFVIVALLSPVISSADASISAPNSLKYNNVGELPDLPEIRDRSSLVVKLTVDMNNKTDSATGTATGFVIQVDPEQHTALILTAAHCLPCREADNSCHIWAKGFFGEVKVDKKSIKMDVPKDLAVFEVKISKNYKIPVQVPFGQASELKAGDRSVWYGYPNLSLRDKQYWILPRPTDYKTLGLRFADGEVLSYAPSYALYNTQLRKVSFQKVLFLKGDFLGGNSGGPVFNKSGEIIGVIVQSYFGNREDLRKVAGYCAGMEPECYQIAISSETILEFLQTAVSQRPT